MKILAALYILVLCGQTLKPNEEAPTYLYSWMNKEKLNELVGMKFKNHKNSAHLFCHTYPWAYGKNFIFTWSDPVSGMFSNPHKEYYGWGESGPALLKMKIKPNKFMETCTELKVSKIGLDSYFQPHADFGDADLIFHKINFSSFGTLYREYTVLNPNIVESFTADPDILKPQLQIERDKIMSGQRYTYSEEECHANKEDYTTREGILNHVIPYLDHYLNSNNENIPEYFKGEKTLI